VPNDLAGQTAIVTGAGRGIGRAIAEALAEAGAAVALTSRTQHELDATVAQIRERGGRALAIAGDVTNCADVERVRDETEATFGPASILVHSAGVLEPFGPTWAVGVEDWWDTHAVHVRGALLYANALVPRMVEDGGGRFMVISSSASQRVDAYISAYNVAKAAQNRLVAHLAAEGRAHGIFAWAIDPGFVITRLTEQVIDSPAAREYIPRFVSDVEQRRCNEDPSVGLQRCAAFCVELASGRGDALSGSYLSPEADTLNPYRRRLRIVRTALRDLVRG
jgi:NAD(P)-dependent dehydrogenase (short-subunit alcohol dehydrogenase family)